ncbi:MAG: type III pantothenate kinase [bacterium]
MNLLVDIGNRRLKWALVERADDFDSDCDNKNAATRGAIEIAADARPALAAAWAHLAAPSAVWASCVGAAAVGRAVDAHARAAWSLRPVFIAARRQQGGVVNGYRDPAGLGGDRWAALIAARARQERRAVIVIDAGTAVTVDLLDGDGRFRGGVILPGVRAMQSALAARAAGIAFDAAASLDVDDASAFDSTASPDADDALAVNRVASPDASRDDALATDTAAAVARGALLAVAGGIDQAVVRQRRAAGETCDALATGGDATVIAPLLATAVEIAPQLVLRGLAVIAETDAGRSRVAR